MCVGVVAPPPAMVLHVGSWGSAARPHPAPGMGWYTLLGGGGPANPQPPGSSTQGLGGGGAIINATPPRCGLWACVCVSVSVCVRVPAQICVDDRSPASRPCVDDRPPASQALR